MIIIYKYNYKNYNVITQIFVVKIEEIEIK